MSNGDYERQIQNWREQMDAGLRADNGWLAVVGLFWLHEGVNTIGTRPSSEVVLPPNSAPDQIGTFELCNGQLVFKSQPGATVTSNGELVTALLIKTNAGGTPTQLSLNTLDWQVLQYDERFAARVWDRNHPARKEFTGRRWFPIDATYRVSASYVRHALPRTLNIATIVDGITEPSVNPGYVMFQLRGQEVQMEAVARADGGLRFIMHDLTSGVSTHPNCRYLDAEPPSGGRAVLDFNMACNLPCAFTPYSICPLPPPKNRLKIAIEAGERYETSHD